MALLVRAGKAIPIEQLDELWPGDPPASARHAVQVYVSRLARTRCACGRTSSTSRSSARSPTTGERRVGDFYVLGEVAQGVAATAVANLRYREAAIVSGACAVLQRYGHSQPYVTKRAFSEAFFRPARTTFGESEWDRLEASGRQLPPAPAIELAVTSAARLAERARSGERLLR